MNNFMAKVKQAAAALGKTNSCRVPQAEPKKINKPIKQ
jgi:hypothetical protein